MIALLVCAHSTMRSKAELSGGMGRPPADTSRHREPAQKSLFPSALLATRYS